MKTFAQYLTESEKTFDYRIKICGEVPEDFLKLFKDKLKKFDPVKVSEPKKTPIQSKPAGFPAFTNEAVTIIDGTFRYPATPPQISQMARLLGLDENKICINELQWSEGMDTELLGIEDQKNLLTNTNYPAPNAEQKALSKDYSAAPADHEVVKNSSAGAKFTVAGGTTKPAETTNDLPMGVKSPLTTIKRPPKPATGFKK
jgi:hypothetical protein